MTRKRVLTRTGLPQFLPSTLRTVKLKELAEKRARRLNILRKFVEMTISGEGDDILNKSKLSIEDFAQSIDLKAGTWSRLERAESCLSIEVSQWIAVKTLKKFGIFVTCDWLLGESELSEDLPRKINLDPFNIMDYLRDLYRVDLYAKDLTLEQKDLVKEIYRELEVTETLTNTGKLKEIIATLGKDFILEKDKALFNTIMKRGDNENTLTKPECSLMKSICRSLIVSSDISSDEKATRLVLIGYLMADLFEKINPESMITYVRDNKMAPVFFKGDIVGGAYIALKNIRTIDKSECIIELKNSIKIIRIVHVISHETIVTGTIGNDTPEIYSINDIQSIAIILFRYKNIERDNLSVTFNGDHSPTLIKFEEIR